MDKTWIYCCEDSTEGIFTAIYEAWASKHGHSCTKILVEGLEGFYNFELFSNYVPVKTDSEKALKVMSSIPDKISEEAYQMVMKAALSNCGDKADVIYHFMVRGFAIGSNVVDFLSDPYVMRIFEINRNVGREAYFYVEFLRFEELVNGIMLARCEPKNDIAALAAPHFLDRFPDDHYMILDVKRKHAAVCAAGQELYMVSFTDEQMDELLKMTDQEDQMKQCWKTFFHSIAVKERTNYRAQRNHLPLHYRKYMLEFH